jgi:hypothetical protein
MAARIINTLAEMIDLLDEYLGAASNGSAKIVGGYLQASKGKQKATLGALGPNYSQAQAEADISEYFAPVRIS